MTNKEIVTTFLKGFNDPDQLDGALTLLAKDYCFNGPMSKASNREEFTIIAKQLSALLKGLKVLRIMEDGDWVSVGYEFYTDLPNLKSTQGSEWFRLESGLIKESHLVYDATGFHKLYDQMKV